MITDADKDKLEHIFTYHAPKGDQAVRYENLRDLGCRLALLIGRECPYSQERSMALTKVQEAVMWANASIAINEKDLFR
jgi:hypothetical protein